MSIFLSHESALFYWRHCWPFSEPLRAPVRVRPPKAQDCTWRHVQECAPWELLDRPEPVHVLCFSAKALRRAEGLACHLWSTPVPASAFRSGGRGLYVSSPEFVFLQLASQLDVIDLIALGMELCGTYVLRPAGEAADEFPQRPEPLTTAKRLKAFAQAATRARGRQKALRAARYLLDGSASPGETDVALFLHLPPLLGGYGIPAPHMNWRIDYDDATALVAGRAYCVGDICWPDRMLDVEYYGAVHGGIGQMRSDAGRSTALALAGYRVLTVTWRQLSSVPQFEKIAREVARRTGQRLQASTLGPTERRMSLRTAVLSWHERGGMPR